MYIINWHTGVEDDACDMLSEAMRFADANACYTQRNITIEDEDGYIICERHWWGTAIDEEEGDLDLRDPIDFGDLGYYDDWRNEAGYVVDEDGEVIYP